MYVRFVCNDAIAKPKSYLGNRCYPVAAQHAGGSHGYLSNSSPATAHPGTALSKAMLLQSNAFNTPPFRNQCCSSTCMSSNISSMRQRLG